MNKINTLTTLLGAALLGSLSASAWSDEVITYGQDAPAEQTPAPDSGVAQGWNPQPGGAYAPAWQQTPYWRAPQQGYGQFPPRYPHAGQYRAYPAAPANTWENPLSTELKQTQEQLAGKTGELDKAHGLLDELRGKLKDSVDTETRLSDKVEYINREQNALRVRVTDLIKTLNASNATLEQQQQLINDHQVHNRQLTAERDQLNSVLAGRDKQLAKLQSELQAATKALAQARSMASTAADALGKTRTQTEVQRENLTRLEAELKHLEIQLRK